MIELDVRRLLRFWFTEGSAVRLATVRVIVGAYALSVLTDRLDSYLRNASTDHGLFDPVGPVALLTAPLSLPVFQGILVATIGLNVLFVLGLWHRLSGPLFSLGLLWVLSYRNSWGNIYHTDNLLVLQVFVLGFTRSADALALGALHPARDSNGRMRLFGPWRFSTPANHWEYGYAVRLLCAVTTIPYFLAGVAKLAGPIGLSWSDGESLRAQVMYDTWRKELLLADPPSVIYDLYHHLWLFTALAVGTLIIELAAPLAALSGMVAAVWVPGAYLMHQGILFIMSIDFHYQLSGVAFAPFIPWDRLFSVSGAIIRRATCLRRNWAQLLAPSRN
jgi:hypothetical protein